MSITTLLLDESGTAYVEALVVVPVLALILSGTLAINAMYSAKLEAKSRARRIAWLQADSGECPATTCLGARCRAIEAEIRADGLDALLSPREGRLSLSSLVGSVGRLLAGGTTHAVGFAEAPLSALLHARRTSQRGEATLFCNTRARYTEPGGSFLEQACSAGLAAMEYAREVCK